MGVGGRMDQLKSAGLVCARHISILADETDFRLQFWLSQVTVMPLVLLSGICKPDRAGRPAHKLVESQVASRMVLDSCTGDPPQPAKIREPAKPRQASLKGN